MGAGAFGGDRAGLGQSILAGQQQTSQAPVIAGLNQANYNQALAEFNNQQQTGLGARSSIDSNWARWVPISAISARATAMSA